MVKKLVAVLAVGFLVVAILHIRTRFALCEEYASEKLVGLSPGAVKARLGVPQLDTEASTTWVYQHGMDPEAFVYFQNGSVVRVEFLLWRCPPFSF